MKRPGPNSGGLFAPLFDSMVNQAQGALSNARGVAGSFLRLLRRIPRLVGHLNSTAALRIGFVRHG